MAAGDVFFDTAGFLALWDRTDEHHSRAVKLQADLTRKRRRFITTDYVVDETTTLLLVRHSHTAATDFLQTIRSTGFLHLKWTDSELFKDAADLFVDHDDKEWSFTDCVSFVVMRNAGLSDCFTSDHHFRQAGFNALLK
jgi:uncharacterized protein